MKSKILIDSLKETELSMLEAMNYDNDYVIGLEMARLIIKRKLIKERSYYET